MALQTQYVGEPVAGATNIEGLFNLISQNIKAMTTLQKHIAQDAVRMEGTNEVVSCPTSMFLTPLREVVGGGGVSEDVSGSVVPVDLCQEEEEDLCQEDVNDIMYGYQFSEDRDLHTRYQEFAGTPMVVPTHPIRRGFGSGHTRNNSSVMTSHMESHVESHMESGTMEQDSSRYGFVKMNIKDFT